MPSTLLRRFLNRFRSDDADADDDSRFVPSRLDMSVRHSHAGGESEANREIARIQQQAEEIEQRRHK